MGSLRVSFCRLLILDPEQSMRLLGDTSSGEVPIPEGTIVRMGTFRRSTEGSGACFPTPAGVTRWSGGLAVPSTVGRRRT